MKWIRIVFMALAMITNVSIFGDEYDPVILVLGPNNEQSSGVIFKADAQKYYGLGAAHNMPSTVTLFGTKGKSRISMATKVDTIKSNKDIDVVYFSLPRYDWVEVKPVELSKESLTGGQSCKSYGYVITPDKVENDVVVINYTSYTTLEGAQILSCSGKRIYGLSGGPLIYKNKVFGIQSSGSTNTVLYCPADQVWNLIEDD